MGSENIDETEKKIYTDYFVSLFLANSKMYSWKIKDYILHIFEIVEFGLVFDVSSDLDDIEHNLMLLHYGLSTVW